jgi:hypothetical protein
VEIELTMLYGVHLAISGVESGVKHHNPYPKWVMVLEEEEVTNFIT